MVNVLGNEIIGAFTNGVAVKSIYTYGELVWPTTPPTYEWYVQWTPSGRMGSFSMFGQTYNLQDYLGCFSWIGGMDSAMITSSAFSHCSLFTVETNVRTIQGEAFTGNTSLSQISLPTCKYIDESAFYWCSLKQIDLPECEHIGSYAFCWNPISRAFLHKCSNICENAFTNTSINLLVLESNSVVSINSSIDTFNRTPFAGCMGSILVPVDLYSSYLTAPGWSSLSCILGSYKYYISWTPNSLSEQFNINSVTYNMSDYSGFYTTPDDITITRNAFSNTHITTLSTNIKTIGSQAFGFCQSLSMADMSQCTNIDMYAFTECSNLLDIYAPLCRNIGSWAFIKCQKLKSVDLPECQYIAESAFYECLSISYINIPKCSYIGNNAFYHCGIESLNLRECKIIDPEAFKGCSNLSVVYLSECLAIYWEAFGECTSLQSIYIYNSYCGLGDSNVFSLTGITSSTGAIYVPTSLLDTYKNDSDWGYFSDRIFSIPT